MPPSALIATAAKTDAENPKHTVSSVAESAPIKSVGFLPTLSLTFAHTVALRNSQNVKTDIRSPMIRAGFALPIPPKDETMENA